MTDARPAPLFIGDAAGLDFLNSIAAPSGEPIEWLEDGRDLLEWLQAARLVPPEVIQQMRGDVSAVELDRVAAQARDLREWFRGFALARAGRPITAGDAADLDRLSRWLERDEPCGAIEPRPARADDDPRPAPISGLRWAWRRRWRTPESLLGPVAQALAELVCDADFRRVKACEGGGCTLLFLDTSKGGARRWCSMAACGNRAKQAAHRARASAAPGGS